MENGGQTNKNNNKHNKRYIRKTTFNNKNKTITMKKIILFFILLIGLTTSINGKDYIKTKKQNVVFKDSTTTDTYTIDTIKYNVYKTKNGAFYIWKISKRTGKKYKYYLPKDIQKQMGRKY